MQHPRKTSFEANHQRHFLCDFLLHPLALIQSQWSIQPTKSNTSELPTRQGFHLLLEKRASVDFKTSQIIMEVNWDWLFHVKALLTSQFLSKKKRIKSKILNRAMISPICIKFTSHLCLDKRTIWFLLYSISLFLKLYINPNKLH